jgi:hypothetical protein
MKKIISKKLYDTETAQVIGSWDNGYYGNDFNSMSETLYRKRTGEYFLYGSGGPRTQYATREGNMWGWGEMITPLTFEEARDWAEEKLTADEYAECFGMPDEGDESKTALTITLPAAKAAAIRQAAEKAGMSIGAYIDANIEVAAK